MRALRMKAGSDSVHEMSLMGGVFDVIDQTLTQYEVQKVTQVKLKVGKMTNAEPDALRFAFEAFSQGTVCEGAKLIIEEVPVRGECKDCGKEFEVEQLFFFCPYCQSPRVKITAGEELLLESLEVE